MPAIATASATAADPNFHDRSIEYEAAMPTAAPAGETIESAVEACVIAIASRNPRPGSAAIHGGGNVARFRSHGSGEQKPVLPAELANDVEDVPVARELREDEDEDGDDDDDRARAAEDPLVGLRQAPPARRRAVRHREEPIVRPSPKPEGVTPWNVHDASRSHQQQ